ncbi:MAG: nucleoside hydrolase [Lachnospiraceae bacterium]|nr:nucleoside hydrolase [Lachnospiraceae bacterium]
MKEKGKKIPMILDGDPGHDDAIAWVLAEASRRSDGIADIRAVTTVGGNVTLDKTTYNARRVCTLIGLKDVPLAAGAAHPLQAELMNAPSVHGESGLDGPALPEPEIEISSLSAVELMAKVLRESREKVTIVSTGPLTNTAVLLLAHPELKKKIERISLMGGGVGFGNWTPAAEFNILVDPEAADVVFRSGVPVIMAGLDVTERALMLPEDFQKIRELGNPVSDIVYQWLEFFYKFHCKLGYAGAPMHDPCAVMVLLHPEIFTIKKYHVEIETEGDYCRGTTVADVRGTTGKEPNADCIMDLDRDAFAAYLIEAVGRY